MIYLILGVLLIIIPIIVLTINDWVDIDKDVFFFFSFLCFLIFFVVMLGGIYTYPHLASERAQCEAYKYAITETAKAYNSSIPVQSMNQLTKYAELVSEYNCDLKSAQIRKKMIASKLFGMGAFISNKVYNLQPIGGVNVNSRGN